MLFVLLYGAGIIARWSRRALSDGTDESENAFFTPCEAKMISKLTGDATAWKWAALCKSLGISFTFEIYFIECFKFCYRTKNFKFTYELTASWKFWSGTVLRQNSYRSSWTYQLTVFFKLIVSLKGNIQTWCDELQALKTSSLTVLEFLENF